MHYSLVSIIEWADSETTSYSAHIGGFCTGTIAGMLLLKNLELTWTEKYLILPTAAFIAIVVSTYLIVWFVAHWPPEEYSLFHDTDLPCCWQLASCHGLAESDYDQFVCKNTYDVRFTGYGNMGSCADLKYYANSTS